MLDVEPVILEELERLAPPGDLVEPAWNEVVRRVGPTRRLVTRRRVVLYGLSAAIVVYLAAPAFGLNPPFLDFFSSKPAPKRVVKDFRQQNVAGAHGFGINPKVLAGKARRITVYHLRNGTPFPLDVAPRRGGGFCFDFGWGGSCTPAHAHVTDEPGDHNIGKLGPSEYGSKIIAGYVTDQKIDHLELRFQDKTRVEIPLLWVSAPINAGFYMHELTRAQHRSGHRPIALVGVDAHGHPVAWVRSMFRSPPAWANPANVSNQADKHIILRSGPVTIAIAPARTGGNCWWLRSRGGAGAGGCAPPRYLTMPMAGGLTHGSDFTAFSAQLQPTVSRVELRFQNGSRAELQPVQGFVLYSIPSTHWPRGTRLVEAIAYNSSGHQLAAQRFDPRQYGVYPCQKPKPLGAGLKACP